MPLLSAAACQHTCVPLQLAVLYSFWGHTCCAPSKLSRRADAVCISHRSSMQDSRLACSTGRRVVRSLLHLNRAQLALSPAAGGSAVAPGQPDGWRPRVHFLSPTGTGKLLRIALHRALRNTAENKVSLYVLRHERL